MQKVKKLMPEDTMFERILLLVYFCAKNSQQGLQTSDAIANLVSSVMICFKEAI